MKKLRVAIAGYGVVGKRRHFYIDQHPKMNVVAVCDKVFKKEKPNYNKKLNYFINYKEMLEREKIDLLFVCLTNNIAAEVTIAGLSKGMHVFCEKPPGMTVKEIENVIKKEKAYPNLKLKYGFNHRYHDSVKKALKIIKSSDLGEVISVRGVYGKSMIVPFSHGWRSKRKLAGGGILLDQGIHMLDLMRLFCGEFIEIKSYISNDFWKHDVEDNAYAIMKDSKGRISMINSSATQWKHKFSLEISLTMGYIELHGILSGSKSYGEETIIIGKRDLNSSNGQMEKTTIKFLNDNSWRDEINEFANCILNNTPIKYGTSNDALQCMKLVNEIYYQDINWRNKFKIKKSN
tara:strand:+ start:36138 stop:37178 length:1041 start_codon:yes stop_codon:yes gene_type:complete